MNRLLLVPLVGCLFAFGCKSGNFSESAPKGNVFRYSMIPNPTTLDPGMVQDGDTIDLLQQVYEGLVAWSPENLPEPRLAESWDIKDGGKAYVFHIRKGVKFHNGRELKAADFKWTFERNTAKDMNSPVAGSYLDDVVGVKEHQAGQAADISGIKVVDDYTLEIDLIRPRAYFLGKLTYLSNAVLPKESVPEKVAIGSVKEMVGTGPFKAERYDPDQVTVLVANKDYYGGAPLVDRIERPVVKDPATRLNKFKAGELDLIQLERQDIPGVQADPKLKDQLHLFDRPSIFYVGMNPKAYDAFRDVRVRRAFAMAINKDRIVKEVLGGVNVVANSIVPPGAFAYRENASVIPYDPAGAKKLLAEAGFADGTKLPRLVINFRADRRDISLAAEAICSDLKENLGINATTESIEWGSYLAKWNRGDVGFFHMRWAADYLDAENFLSHMLATFGPENRGINYANPEFDALCAEADSSLDPERRKELYAKAEDMVLQDAPWVPIYFQRDAELISPRVVGLRESLFGHLPHTTVRLKK